MFRSITRRSTLLSASAGLPARSAPLLLLAALATGGLARDLSAAPVPGTVPRVNTGSTAPSQAQLDRAVKLPACTATRIATHWAISALHCVPKVGDDVWFYDGRIRRASGIGTLAIDHHPSPRTPILPMRGPLDVRAFWQSGANSAACS